MIDATLAYLRGDEDIEQPRPTDVAAMLATLVDAAVDGGKKAMLAAALTRSCGSGH